MSLTESKEKLISEYAEGRLISGEGRAGSLQRAKGHASNENWKLSITGMAWAALDVLTAVFAAYLALRYRTVMVRDHAGSLTVIVAGGVRMFALSMGWFAVCLVFLAIPMASMVLLRDEAVCMSSA